MKIRIFTFIFLSWVFCATIFISSQQADDSNPIILAGDFDSGGLRSTENSVTATVQGNVIIAVFHRNVGNLLVTLTNGAGDTVYEATVNTSVQSQASILLSGLPSGLYIITFSNHLGAMYGDFEI